jgi:protein-disulfide isomerase
MKKASWFIALVVGIVIGVVGDRMVSGQGVRPLAPQQPTARPAQPAAPRPPPPPAAVKVPLRPDDPLKGPAVAKLTVVEFSDFQCPFCSRVNPTLKQLEEAFPGQIRFAWKHQPLSFHPNAMPAAIASEAAREQGKFWAFHDLAFANQANLSAASYEAWAGQIGADVARFKKAVGAQSGKARVDADMQLGNQVGAGATPTLFLNCRRLVGAQPLETFKAVAEEELKKADALLARGLALDAGFYDRVCDENVKAMPAAAELPRPQPTPAGPMDVPLRGDEPARGAAKAQVTIVEFSDFQCPFCSRVVPTMKQIEQEYGSRVRIVWKHQPIPSLHPEAMPAALAAEAARQQGRFWEMHDKLFDNQRALGASAYEGFARELGLDLARFRTAMLDPRTRERVQADQDVAVRVGATGTPTFFVNGERVVGAMPYDTFKAAVDRALAKR